MLELSEYIHKGMDRKPSKADISLSGWLEAFVGNYFVWGEGGGDPNFHWIAVYYDPDIDPVYEAVETVPEKLVAYVSSDYQWAFVLSRHLPKFRKDTADYGMVYIPISEFGQELLKCSDTGLLPPEFSGIVWIDDDFLDDDSIPFDFDSFSLIDDGIAYLNPNHFSVIQLMRNINISREENTV